MKKCAVLLTIVLLLAGCQASEDKKTDKVKTDAPVLELEATKLASDYAENETVADNKYKGKIVVVKGKIYQIGRDPLGQPFIVIGGRAFGHGGVQCVFARDKDASLVALSKGKDVSVKGKVSGKIVFVRVEDSSLQ
ncbi:MAG: hypothetical protein ABFD57_06375 [Smithella sp.]|nr:hypothetical protein [Syntrophaceae bacterium]NTW76771.1 hypothetical protein [Syntrophaceae bacterium]